MIYKRKNGPKTYKTNKTIKTTTTARAKNETNLVSQSVFFRFKTTTVYLSHFLDLNYLYRFAA